MGNETKIINEKTDSISIDKGMSGKFGFSVKIYGDLNKEGDKMLEKVEGYIEKLNEKYNNKEA